MKVMRSEHDAHRALQAGIPAGGAHTCKSCAREGRPHPYTRCVCGHEYCAHQWTQCPRSHWENHPKDDGKRLTQRRQSQQQAIDYYEHQARMAERGLTTRRSADFYRRQVAYFLTQDR